MVLNQSACVSCSILKTSSLTPDRQISNLLPKNAPLLAGGGGWVLVHPSKFASLCCTTAPSRTLLWWCISICSEILITSFNTPFFLSRSHLQIPSLVIFVSEWNHHTASTAHSLRIVANMDFQRKFKWSQTKTNKQKSQQANYYLSQEETQSNKNLLRNIKIE